MAQVTPRWCEDHRTSYLGACPFCTAGLEPVRFLEARADFQGVPLAGTHDILPHYPMVSIEDALAVLGQQLAGLEVLEAQAIEPYARAKQLLYREMRRMRVDPKLMQQAVRVHLGIPGSERLQQSPALHALVLLLGRDLTSRG